MPLKQISSTETLKAQRDARASTRSGRTLKFLKDAPGTTDAFGEGTEDSDAVTVKANPVRFQPFERKVSQSIGWSAEVDAIAFVSKLDIDDLSLDADKLRNFAGAEYDGRTYDIFEIEPHMHVGGDYLYYRIGMKKKGQAGG